MRLNIMFLSVEPRFRYCFLSPVPYGTNLASRFKVRRQLRLTCERNAGSMSPEQWLCLERNGGSHLPDTWLNRARNIQNQCSLKRKLVPSERNLQRIKAVLYNTKKSDISLCEKVKSNYGL